MAEEKEYPPELYYLLIAGTTESKGVQYADKTRANGSYLQGCTKDIANMESWVNQEEGSIVQNKMMDMRYAKRATVLDRIRRCALECEEKDGLSVALYYTGHGQTNTGNWCFSDGVITLKEVLDTVNEAFPGNSGTWLHCDCCYSGDWLTALSRMKVIHTTWIYTASWPGMVAFDTVDGGMWTLKHTGKREAKDMADLCYCYGCKEIKGKFFGQCAFK